MSRRLPDDDREERHPEGGTRVGRAVLLTLVGIVIGILLLTRLGSTPTRAVSSRAAPTTTTVPAAPTPAATPSTTTVPPSRVKLQVLNGVLSGSLSSEFSSELHGQYGYDTLAPDNATAAVNASSIYIVTSGYLPEAEALAKDLDLPSNDIVTAVPPPTSAPIPSTVLSSANLVLVVGPDLAAKAPSSTTTTAG